MLPLSKYFPSNVWNDRIILEASTDRQKVRAIVTEFNPLPSIQLVQYISSWTSLNNKINEL